MSRVRTTIASIMLLAALAAASVAAQGVSAQPPAKVTVTDKGFEPAKLTDKAGESARITSIRTAEKTCAPRSSSRITTSVRPSR